MNRRQVLLGSAATVAAATLPVAAVLADELIMPLPYAPGPAMIAAQKLFWDCEREIIRVTSISFEELYITGNGE